MNRIVPVLALVALSACGSIQPLSGDYLSSRVTLIQDECGFTEENGLPTLSMTLTVVDDAVTINIDEAEDLTFDCTLDGNDLICPDASRRIETGGDNGDATLVLTWSLGATFIDESVMDPVEVAVGYSCEGADCDTATEGSDLQLPCLTTLTLVATMQ